MLLAIMAMYWQYGTTDIPQLLAYKLPAQMQTWLGLLLRLLRGEDADVAGPHLAAGCHVQADGGSVILAGIC